MPIRADLRHHYRGPQWKATRERILARANNCCEQCGAPNKTTVLRAFAWWTPATLEATVFKGKGRINGKPVTELPWKFKPDMEPQLSYFPVEDSAKWAPIQLGIAHLDHDPTNNADHNLKALCRRCHLIHDLGKHKETRSIRKDAARPLLGVAR